MKIRPMLVTPPFSQEQALLDAMRQLFQQADTDASGGLSRLEFRAAVCAAGRDQLTQHQHSLLFNTFDINRNGSLGLDELCFQLSSTAAGRSEVNPILADRVDAILSTAGKGKKNTNRELGLRSLAMETYTEFAVSLLHVLVVAACVAIILMQKFRVGAECVIQEYESGEILNASASAPVTALDLDDDGRNGTKQPAAVCGEYTRERGQNQSIHCDLEELCTWTGTWEKGLCKLTSEILECDIFIGMPGGAHCPLDTNPNCYWDNGFCRSLPDCPRGSDPKCPYNSIGDGKCDVNCRTKACAWDGGDCDPMTGYARCTKCDRTQMANGVCDEGCNTEPCGWDAGDCCNGFIGREWAWVWVPLSMVASVVYLLLIKRHTDNSNGANMMAHVMHGLPELVEHIVQVKQSSVQYKWEIECFHMEDTGRDQRHHSHATEAGKREKKKVVTNRVKKQGTINAVDVSPPFIPHTTCPLTQLTTKVDLDFSQSNYLESKENWMASNRSDSQQTESSSEKVSDLQESILVEWVSGTKPWWMRCGWAYAFMCCMLQPCWRLGLDARTNTQQFTFSKNCLEVAS